MKNQKQTKPLDKEQEVYKSNTGEMKMLKDIYNQGYSQAKADLLKEVFKIINKEVNNPNESAWAKQLLSELKQKLKEVSK